MKSSSLYFPNNNTLLDNLIPSNGATCIFIIVIITILGIVVLANIMRIENILDTQEEYERRNRRPINLVYFFVTNPRPGSPTLPFVVDKNDPTATNMTAFLGRRLPTQGHGTPYMGFRGKNNLITPEGALMLNADAHILDALEADGLSVQTKGLPIQRIPGSSQFVCHILVLREDIQN